MCFYRGVEKERGVNGVVQEGGRGGGEGGEGGERRDRRGREGVGAAS